MANQTYYTFSESDIYNDGFGNYVTEQQRKKQLEEAVIAAEKIENAKHKAANISSVIGGGISLINHPYAKAAGLILQLPDLIYDLKDAENDFSNKNKYHLGLDILAALGGFTPIRGDDYLNAAGMIDDSLQAADIDSYDEIKSFVDSIINRYKQNKDKRDRPSLEDKR